MGNALQGLGPVQVLTHNPAVTTGAAPPLAGMDFFYRVPPAPFSDGIVIRAFRCYAAGEVATASLSFDLQTGLNTGALATALTAVVTFTADQTVFTTATLVNQASNASDITVGARGIVVPAGNIVAILFTGADWSVTDYFADVAAQIEYNAYRNTALDADPA